jgi:hypothetical protein
MNRFMAVIVRAKIGQDIIESAVMGAEAPVVQSIPPNATKRDVMKVVIRNAEAHHDQVRYAF